MSTWEDSKMQISGSALPLRYTYISYAIRHNTLRNNKNYGECNNGHSRFSHTILYIPPSSVGITPLLSSLAFHYYILPLGRFLKQTVMVTRTSGATARRVDYFAMHMVRGAVTVMQLICSCKFL